MQPKSCDFFLIQQKDTGTKKNGHVYGGRGVKRVKSLNFIAEKHQAMPKIEDL